MKLIKKGDGISKIVFSKSVEELIEENSKVAIKSILGRVDLIEDTDKKRIIRKEVLDSINDMTRVFVQIVEGLTK